MESPLHSSKHRGAYNDMIFALISVIRLLKTIIMFDEQEWSWVSECSDTADSGLHGVIGSMTATEYTGFVS